MQLFLSTVTNLSHQEVLYPAKFCCTELCNNFIRAHTFSDLVVWFQVIRVFQVSLVVRVCLDFLVTLSRVKDSGENLDFQDDRDLQATPDQREKLESWDSLARLDQE